MATTKTWVGTTGDFQLSTNWLPVNVRNAAYSWTVSGSGTGEYYLRTAASGDPGIPEPPTVLAAGVALTPGTAGSLATGTWDYADNDTLGYSTIYVRLADGADPDTKADGHVTYRDVPRTGDAVVIPQGSGTITSNADYSTVTLGKVTTGLGQSAAIASPTAYLKLKCTGFEHSGSGVAYIDLHDSAVVAVVKATAIPSTGLRGLYLKGSAITVLVIEGGDTGFAWLGGETGAATTVRVDNGTLWIGSGVSTITDLQLEGGNVRCACGATTITQLAGTLTTEGAGAVGTVNIHGGDFFPNSSGTITTCNITGGNIDFYDTGVARTVTTLNLKRGTSWSVKLNKEAVTYTTIVGFDTQKLSGGNL
jgi:hypothetical protein